MSSQILAHRQAVSYTRNLPIPAAIEPLRLCQRGSRADPSYASAAKGIPFPLSWSFVSWRDRESDSQANIDRFIDFPSHQWSQIQCTICATERQPMLSVKFVSLALEAHWRKWQRCSRINLDAEKKRAFPSCNLLTPHASFPHLQCLPCSFHQLWKLHFLSWLWAFLCLEAPCHLHSLRTFPDSQPNCLTCYTQWISWRLSLDQSLGWRYEASSSTLACLRLSFQRFRPASVCYTSWNWSKIRHSPAPCSACPDTRS